MDLKYHIGGDGDFRALEQGIQMVNRLQSAQEASNAAQNQRPRDVSGRFMTTNKLRQEELELVEKLKKAEAAGTASEAERLRTQLVEKRLNLQRQLTFEQAQAGKAVPNAPRIDDTRSKPTPPDGAWGRIAGEVLAAGRALAAPLAGLAGGAAVVNSLRGFVDGIVARAGALKDVAEQLSLNTDEVQQLDRAAAGAGLQVTQFFGALSQLGAARRAAAEGDDKLERRFERFGISMKMLQDPTLKTIDLLKALGRVSGDLNAADRTAIRDLLGGRGERVASAIAGLGTGDAAGVEQKNIEALDRFEKASSGAFKRLRDLGAQVFGSILRDDMGSAADHLITAVRTRWTALGEWMGNQIRPPAQTTEADARTAYNRAMIQARSEHARRNTRTIEDANGNVRTVVDPMTAEQIAAAEEGFTGPAAQYAKWKKFRDEAQKKLDLATADVAGGEQNKDWAERRWAAAMEENARLEQKFLNGGLTPAEEKRWTEVKREQELAQRDADLGQAQRATGAQRQAEARQDLGLSFEDALARAQQGQGPLFNGAEDLAKANAKARAALEFEMLDNTRKRARIEADIAALKEKKAQAESPVAKEKIEAEILEKRAQLLQFDARNKTDGFRVATPNLQRVGGFTGGVGGFDPAQTRLDAIHAASSGNLAVARQMLARLSGPLEVHFQ